MKFITIQFSMVWLVLQATLHEVYCSSLRGPSSSSVATMDVTSKGSRFEYDDCKHRCAQEEEEGDLEVSAVLFDGQLIKAGPEGGADVNAPTMAVTEKSEDDAESVPSLDAMAARTCMPITEVFFGHDPLQPYSILKGYNQAKIWVISTDPNHHNQMKSNWHDLKLAPRGFEGDISCAKFFAIGAEAGGPALKKLVGDVNRDPDVKNPLQYPIKVSRGIDPIKLYTQVARAIDIMNSNFGSVHSYLEYELIPFLEWYKIGYGWNEFNANGFISGLISFLDMNVILPGNYPSMEGWKKPVPKTLFDTQYYTKSSVSLEVKNAMNQRVKDAVYKMQPCKGGKFEVWFGHHPVHPVPTKLDWVDHAKIWVISSDRSEHELTGLKTVWQYLSRDKVPLGYNGDENCAKFYTI